MSLPRTSPWSSLVDGRAASRSVRFPLFDVHVRICARLSLAMMHLHSHLPPPSDAMASGHVGAVPTDFERKPPHLNLPHALYVPEAAGGHAFRALTPLLFVPDSELNIPFGSAFHAQTAYRVMSVDKPLRPADTHIAFRIASTPSSTTTTLDISLHASSVRQLRLSANAILDDVSLIVETMDAFPRSEEQESAEGVGRERDDEFELSGTGRAG